ncbi:hypothetical protein ACFYWX_36705 [Streptomyces sp. NPDC002888]|uniref:hypothetical protein n=1 Tax=Streptomyces sp. NPDC002888 TaxID=3364668 RepID=UPI0036BC9E3A
MVVELLHVGVVEGHGAGAYQNLAGAGFRHANLAGLALGCGAAEERGHCRGHPDHETYRWNVHDDRRRDFWGNAVIESWYKEATPVLGLEGSPQPVSHALLDESAVIVGADGLG